MVALTEKNDLKERSMRRDAHERLLNPTRQYYQGALKESGLQIHQGKIYSAPTWEAERQAEVRKYEAQYRIAGLSELGETAIDAIAGVSRKIDPEFIHPATQSGMRAVEETVTRGVIEVIARYATGCGGTCPECMRGRR